MNLQSGMVGLCHETLLFIFTVCLLRWMFQWFQLWIHCLSIKTINGWISDQGFSNFIIWLCFLSPAFQRFAVRTSRRMEDISIKGMYFVPHLRTALGCIDPYIIKTCYFWMQLHRRGRNLLSRWRSCQRILRFEVLPCVLKT